MAPGRRVRVVVREEVILEDVGGEMPEHPLRDAPAREVDELLLVDRLVERLAHVEVVERRHGHVDA